MTNLNNLVFMCKEIFDENSEPTKIEIEEQASRLGIDPVKESHLLSIAKQCLLEPLPSNWLPCYIEKENKYFYYNVQNKTSQWEHPLDEYYRQIVEKTRAEDSSTGRDISLDTILDEDNLLGNMYYTKDNNNEKKSNEKRTVRFKTPIEESLDLDNSEDNMKFLGPIKLNTPNYGNTSSTLHNLPQFSTNNTFDFRNTTSRSVLSKYNVLPSKDESNRKSDLEENLKKIDITLTESSDHSESTSSEIHTRNVYSDFEGNNVIEKNKHNENNDNFVTGDRKSESNNFNEKLQSMEVTKMSNIKKDDLISDSGNSSEKDSRIIQSSMINNSFSVTKSKMTEITQRFPINQFTNETKLVKIKPIEENLNTFETKSHSVNSKMELTDKLHVEEQSNEAHIKQIIESNCNLIKNELEDTIKTKENIFRDEIIKKIDNLIFEQKKYFEKHIEAQYKELVIKNESELKNLQEKTGKSFIEEYEKKFVQNVPYLEQICTENLSKFQKNVENFADMFKHKIQSEIEIINNDLKKEFYKNAEIITDSWNQTLESYKNIELEKIKNNLEQTTENIKHDMSLEICQLNLEFKKKLNIITEDKLNNISERLDEALREEINVVKNRVNENYQHDVNVKAHKSVSRLDIDHSALGLNTEYPSVNIQIDNYSDIRKKIEHCSNELNDALKLVNELLPARHDISLHSNKCTVSCQTDNKITSQSIPSLKEYNYNIYPDTSNIPIFYNPYDFNTKYTDYWNRANNSANLYSNYMMTYPQVLDILSQEELKVNEAEQNICRLISTLNDFNCTNIDLPNNINRHQNKFSSVYPALTPKQIAYNRTKHLRDWLYNTNMKNKNTFH